MQPRPQTLTQAWLFWGRVCFNGKEHYNICFELNQRSYEKALSLGIVWEKVRAKMRRRAFEVI